MLIQRFSCEPYNYCTSKGGFNQDDSCMTIRENRNALIPQYESGEPQRTDLKRIRSLGFPDNVV